MTQEQQVIEKIKELGGYATLRRLYEALDFSSWHTKTPQESVRRIVQKSDAIFKIRPGLWALESCRDKILSQFNIQPDNRQNEALFTHSFYQGLIIEIGNLQNFTTYIPPQDQHKKYLEQELGSLAGISAIPPFTYERILRKAKTVDVIWFNERQMPTHFYEIEHTTDIKNSLLKFYELQDFFASFFIVANSHRRREFEDKINDSAFNSIISRVKFLDYERVSAFHSSLNIQNGVKW
ncbi:MAG: hypothetical protein HDS85_00950 [Bacteroidales bacterium]|nr:hypothetical protein [Bacteroidales bacterium]